MSASRRYHRECDIRVGYTSYGTPGLAYPNIRITRRDSGVLSVSLDIGGVEHSAIFTRVVEKLNGSSSNFVNNFMKFRLEMYPDKTRLLASGGLPGVGDNGVIRQAHQKPSTSSGWRILAAPRGRRVRLGSMHDEQT